MGLIEVCEIMNTPKDTDLSPEKALEATLSKTDLVNISKDAIENVLDSLTENEVFRAIPICNYVLNSMKGIISIREYFFTKKILRFLYELRDIPFEERNRFVEGINSDSKEKQHVGSTLIGLIEKIEDESKASILGYLFKDMISESIDYKRGRKYAHIIVSAHEGDLRHFAGMQTQDLRKDQSIADILLGWGCITLLGGMIMTSINKEPPPAEMKLNDLGRGFQTFLVDYYKSDNR